MLSCRQLVEEVTQEPDLMEKKGSASWNMRLHLLMCRHCRRYVRQLQLLLQYLSVFARHDPAEPSVVDKVWNDIKHHKDDS